MFRTGRPSTVTLTSVMSVKPWKAQSVSSSVVVTPFVAPEQKFPAGLIKNPRPGGAVHDAETAPSKLPARNHARGDAPGPQLSGLRNGFAGVGAPNAHWSQSSAHCV